MAERTVAEFALNDGHRLPYLARVHGFGLRPRLAVRVLDVDREPWRKDGLFLIVALLPLVARREAFLQLLPVLLCFKKTINASQAIRGRHRVDGLYSASFAISSFESSRYKVISLSPSYHGCTLGLLVVLNIVI